MRRTSRQQAELVARLERIEQALARTSSALSRNA